MKRWRLLGLALWIGFGLYAMRLEKVAWGEAALLVTLLPMLLAGARER